MRFLTPRHGFAISERGRLLSTRNGGRTWSVLRPLKASFGTMVGALTFPNSRDGWVAAEDRLLRTRDGGRTWRRLRSPCGRVTLYIGGVSFLDSRRGYLVCGGQPATDMQAKEVYFSGDGGRTWHRRACTDFGAGPGCRGLPSVGHVRGLDFRDSRVGLLVTGRGGIARTSDGGRRWGYRLFLDDTDDVVATSWASSTTVYALLYHGARLLRSDDSGRHWRRL